MKDPERHFITKAIKRLRIWFSQKKRVMAQAQDLRRQLAEAWREKAQLEEETAALKLKLKDKQQAINNYEYSVAALKREIKALPDKLKWISDNASHKVAPHWLKTQLYGLAREIETGHFSVGTKDYHKVDTLADTQESDA